MKFQDDKPIFLQIEELIERKILEGKFPPGERLPALREMAVDLEVNPNTVVRSFSNLESEGILTKERGIGYFVDVAARKVILQKRKKIFLQKDVPEFLAKALLYGIDASYLTQLIKEKL